MSAIHPIHLFSERDVTAVRHFVDGIDDFFILNLYSPKGFGRTTFLRYIWTEYKQNVPTAFIKVLDYVSKEESGFRLNDLISDIFQQLASHLSISKYQSDYGSSLNDFERWSQEIRKIFEYIITQEKKPLVFIDDYDLIPEDARVGFENNILSELYNHTYSVLLILTSQQRLEFTNRTDLRLITWNHALNPLIEEDVSNLLPSYSDLAPGIIKWSGGIPNVIEFIVDRIDHFSINKPTDFKSHEWELLNNDYSNRLTNILLPDAETASGDILEILSILRRFDSSLLSDVLLRINPKKYSTNKEKHYIKLIRELRSQVIWREQGGYALDNPLKLMLLSYMRNYKLDQFIKVNEVTNEVYQLWLQDQYRNHYLCEMLYHRMILEKQRGSGNEDIAEMINSKLSDFIEGREKTRPRKIVELDELRNMLLIDIDLRSLVRREIFELIDKTLEL